MVALCNIGRRPLYFCPVVSIFIFSSFFFSSPNLSGRRLDVYHTSTHGVALVRILESMCCTRLAANSSFTCPDNMVNFGLLTAEIRWRLWGTAANFNGFRVLAALLHGTLVGLLLVVGISQTLRR